MKFAYDSTQPHQLAAINAVLDLFQDHPTLSPRMVAVDIPGEATVHAVPNRLMLSDSHLLANLQRVQARSVISLAPGGADLSLSPAMMTRQFADATGGMLAGKTAEFPNFSVEMETGTGKTYVYLRTIRELHRRFGFFEVHHRGSVCCDSGGRAARDALVGFAFVRLVRGFVQGCLL